MAKRLICLNCGEDGIEEKDQLCPECLRLLDIIHDCTKKWATAKRTSRGERAAGRKLCEAMEAYDKRVPKEE